MKRGSPLCIQQRRVVDSQLLAIVAECKLECVVIEFGRQRALKVRRHHAVAAGSVEIAVDIQAAASAARCVAVREVGCWWRA
jgi:hypothetical protein